MDLGRASAVELPEEETQRRLEATNRQWPIMHAVLHGVSRDPFMARHRANHLNVAYAPDAGTADKALRAKAALFAELGGGSISAGTSRSRSRCARGPVPRCSRRGTGLSGGSPVPACSAVRPARNGCRRRAARGCRPIDVVS